MWAVWDHSRGGRSWRRGVACAGVLGLPMLAVRVGHFGGRRDAADPRDPGIAASGSWKVEGACTTAGFEGSPSAPPDMTGMRSEYSHARRVARPEFPGVAPGVGLVCTAPTDTAAPKGYQDHGDLDPPRAQRPRHAGGGGPHPGHRPIQLCPRLGQAGRAGRLAVVVEATALVATAGPTIVVVPLTGNG